jgi:hypothetical protein
VIGLNFGRVYLFWPGATEGFRYQKIVGVRVKGSESVEAVYVPFLSKAVFDRWHNLLAKDEPVGLLPYHQCRVVMKFSPRELDTQFSGAAAALRDGKQFDPAIEKQQSVSGSIRRLADEDKAIVEAMTRLGSGYDAKKTLVLTPNGGGDRKLNLILGLAFCVYGALTFLALGVWAVRRWRKPKANKSALLSPDTEMGSPGNP